MAAAGGARDVDFSKSDVYDALIARTDNRGPDSCVDAVGCEASGHGAVDAIVDKVKGAAYLATDRGDMLIREAMSVLPEGRHDFYSRHACRHGRRGPHRRRDEQGPHNQDGAEPTCKPTQSRSWKRSRRGRQTRVSW